MKALHASREQAESAAEKLRAFAQPQRLMILSLLLEGERSVSEIERATGMSQPTVSQQLAGLRRAELVKTRREAKQVYYSLADDATLLCVRSIEAMFGSGDNPERALMEAVRAPRAAAAQAAGPDRGAARFARIL